MKLAKETMVFSTLLMAMLAVPLAVQSVSAEQRLPVKIEGKETLQLRVLSRAFSNIYKGPDDKSGTVQENVPAFESYYVYTKKAPTGDLEGKSWYEVGSDAKGTVLGWMSSDDAFEWKQTMCLSYTHPDGRFPVLMFDKKEGLETLTKLPDAQRKEQVEELYLDIAQGEIPATFPVVTLEPKKAIDIAKEFYLLPILDFSEIEMNNREARILKLAAVTKEEGGARESSDIRKNKEYLQQAVASETEFSAAALEKLGVDIVWVMDTTNSMMPYITQTLKVVEAASKRISQNADLGKSVRFGVWGYRDSESIPNIEYNVKNYTPQLQGIDQFIPVLQTVKATQIGSEGYDEDMFSGMKGAVDDTAWRPTAIKFVILVGDAPAHVLGHKWNASGQDQNTLRAIADDRKLTVFAFHIKDPQAEKFHTLTMEQMKTLTTNRGQEGPPAYFSAASDDLSGFEKATKEVTDAVFSLLEKAGQEKKKASLAAAPNTVSDLKTTTAQATPATAQDKPVNLDLFGGVPTTPQKQTQQSAASLANAALKAAFVEWIGSQAGAKAPRDVVAWVTDKDLISTDMQSLEVRLLVTKSQLDSLRGTLKTILEAGRKGQLPGENFFASLQAAAATTARDPEMIKKAQSLAQTGLIPEFLAGLPYKSRIMDMNNELWNSWSADEQDSFLADVEARVMAYETIHDSPEGWVQLNKKDDPSEYVYPITLELLP